MHRAGPELPDARRMESGDERSVPMSDSTPVRPNLAARFRSELCEDSCKVRGIGEHLSWPPIDSVRAPRRLGVDVQKIEPTTASRATHKGEETRRWRLWTMRCAELQRREA